MEKRRRNKFSIEDKDKERAVNLVLKDGLSCSGVAKLLATSDRLISLWVACYKLHGRSGLSQRNKIRYTGDLNIS